jgi:hypothetical protein
MRHNDTKTERRPRGETSGTEKTGLLWSEERAKTETQSSRLMKSGPDRSVEASCKWLATMLLNPYSMVEGVPQSS